MLSGVWASSFLPGALMTDEWGAGWYSRRDILFSTTAVSFDGSDSTGTGMAVLIGVRLVAIVEAHAVPLFPRGGRLIIALSCLPLLTFVLSKPDTAGRDNMRTSCDSS